MWRISLAYGGGFVKRTSAGFAEGAAAVDGEADAGDEVVFEEGGDGVGDVFGSAGAADECAGDCAAAFFFGDAFGQEHGAGEDGVDADFRRQLDGEHARERGDRAFGDEVRAVVAVGALDGPVADVDDRAAFVLARS